MLTWVTIFQEEEITTCITTGRLRKVMCFYFFKQYQLPARYDPPWHMQVPHNLMPLSYNTV